MDPVIDAIVQRVLVGRFVTVPVAQMRAWAEHLRDTVQPQLDELAALKAAKADKKKS